MPTFEYRCEECGYQFDKVTTVALRDCMACPHCDGITERIFTPTLSIVIPGHFMLDRGWADPPPGDPAWANMSGPGSRSQIHKPKTKTLRQEFDEVTQWE